MSLDSFREKSKGKKVVLLYPWSNYRNLFLAYFLTGARDGLLYYRIPHEETNLGAWLLGLVNELHEVLGSFGGNVRKAVSENAKPAQLGDALATDMANFSSEPTTLYIDELDRVSLDSSFNQFIQALLKNMPKRTQIALNSRLITYQPWYDMVARGEAIVLGTEHRKNDVIFTVEEEPKPQLEVYAMGRGHALVNGQEITNWDGALPRNLFFYFMDNPLVTRDEIFQTFWPDLSVKEATNVFHVTKRKISERISMKVPEGGNYELTQYSSGFYMPSAKIVRHYDASDFREAIERAMIAASEREEETLYKTAIDFYRGTFLQTVNMKWAEERRTQLRQLYAQALIGVGRLHKNRNESEQALGYFMRALKEMPEREDVHRDVMLMYINLGMPGDAKMQYLKLERQLRETLNISPSRETTEILKLIES
jgi:two-component SAPR family response regulator